MKGWPVVPLRRVAIEMQPGFARQPTGGDEGLPQLRTNNVSRDGQIDLSLVKRVPAKKAEVAKYSLSPGDVLFNNTNSPALVGKTALFNEDVPYLFSNHMTRIRVNAQILEPGFLARFLHKQWESGAFRGLVTQWVSQAAINREQLGGVGVPLPPLSEQRRIVEILDQADHLRRLRTEANTKAARILPALFLKMFGDPATNPMEWPQVPLAEISIEMKYGTSTRCHVGGDGIPVLRIPNVVSGAIDLGDVKFAHLQEKDFEKLRLGSGDLLFVRTNGNPEYVGRCAVFDIPGHYAFASYLIRTSLDGSRVEPGYVAAFLATPMGRSALTPFIRTTAGQSNISTAGLKQVSIPLPPIELQREFCGQVAKVQRVAQANSESSDRLASVFRVLLSRAFSGVLTKAWRIDRGDGLAREAELQTAALAESAS